MQLAPAEQNEEQAGALIVAPADRAAMADLWDDWDRRVKSSGRPHRVASDLTDAELVRLLASETNGRSMERRLLSDELFQRLHRHAAPESSEQARRYVPSEERTWPQLGPEAGP